MATRTARPKTLPDKLEAESIFASQFSKHFTTYDVELVGKTPICGGLPSDPNMIKGWLQRNAGIVKGDDQHKRLIIETVESLGYDVTALAEFAERDLSELLDKATEIVHAGSKVVQFARTPLGELCLGHRNVKAMIKESAAIIFPTKFMSKEDGKWLSNQDTKKGKTLKSLVPEWVFPAPDRIGFGVVEPTEVREQVGHTSNGAHLSAFEVIEDWKLSFQINVLHDLIGSDIWPHLWIHAEKNGLGANRSMGFGQFVITKWEKV
jgi:hypothetical protein